MVSRADAEALRLAQVGVRVLVERELRTFWSTLDLSRPDRARDLLLAFVPALVQQYGGDAAAFAADWYDDQRAQARVPGRFRADVVPSPYLSAAEPMVRRAVGPLYQGDGAATLTTLVASVGKYALAAPRATVARAAIEDPRAAGWQRVARPGACGFCRMLTGRGAVYRRETAHFASHGACNCAAVPSWDADAPEVDVRQYVASERMTALKVRAANGDASAQRQLDAHRARVRAYVEDYDT